ncbi:1,4-dihydroxy-2-naphthoate octaprenyltransferase [Arsenophonus endosymbiont of Bemisia tabaci Q2]|nr:1,4-dihydroxy-2-naphthoate octaprenyltransferase [Arsenophonus endosymbiont of Bemisia tabaci Q2]
MNLITSRKPIQIKVWLESLRPKTLPLGIAPIITGSGLAYWSGTFTLSIALLALLTAAALQILSNLANDYGYAIKGSYTEERLGPLRGIQKGIISLAEMKVALKITIFICCLCGLTLIIVACRMPKDIIGFLILGVIAIIGAITYTVWKKPMDIWGLATSQCCSFLVG